MRSTWRAIGLGFLSWLIPFVIAFLSFSLRQSQRPLFESIMAVTVTSCAVLLGLIYFRGSGGRSSREGLLVGIIWFAICVLVDAPLMLLGGPMKMTFAQYFGDIGLTYVSIPVVTWGLGTIGRSVARETA